MSAPERELSAAMAARERGRDSAFNTLQKALTNFAMPASGVRSGAVIAFEQKGRPFEHEERNDNKNLLIFSDGLRKHNRINAILK